MYTALVLETHQNQPTLYEAKEIHQILDEKPIATELQLKHWLWIASYYMCGIGDVYRGAFPSALLLESETVITTQPNTSIIISDLNDDEYLIYEALQQQSVLKVSDVIEIVLAYFQLSASEKKPITVKKLVETSQSSSAVVKALIEKQIFEEYYIQHDRVNFSGAINEKELLLSEPQQIAFTSIKNSFVELNWATAIEINNDGFEFFHITKWCKCQLKYRINLTGELFFLRAQLLFNQR